MERAWHGGLLVGPSGALPPGVYPPPMALDDTHDPNLKSWVESANDPASDFPIQNLPLCRFERDGDAAPDAASSEAPDAFSEHDPRREGVGVVIGDRVVDVLDMFDAGLFDGFSDDVELLGDTLEALVVDGVVLDESGEWASVVRRAAGAFLRDGPAGGQRARRQRASLVRPLRPERLRPLLPVRNYTDFYASIDHARTVGSMFRPDNPLLPNYRHVPIGYHGRASSVVVSGTDVRRPTGQQSPPEDQPGSGPTFGPCAMLDYEAELGCVIGGGNALGEPVPIGRARERMLGLCLLNDWSARDVQKWEYQPLGPFLAKNFCTTVSPMVVTREAIEPFRCAVRRPEGSPRPLDYLWDDEDQRSGGLDVTVEAYLRTARMAERGMPAARLSRGSAGGLYWTFAQMIAHHTSNGCNLEPGDLLGSGTVSGPEPESRGCLLELTWAGPGKPRTPITLPTGETRLFLQDGDTVMLRAFCAREGFRRIGFGECVGTVLPARQ